MSDRFSKILAVTLLTVLIWTWAYMSLEQTDTLHGTLEVGPVDESLLVTFSLPNSDFAITEVPLTSLTFRGPPSRISGLRENYNRPLQDSDRERLNFSYTPPLAQSGGTYSLDLLDYLQKENSKMHELALTLDDCDPKMIDVRVEKLEKKKLPVKVLDQNGLQLPGVTVEPSVVTMYVRSANEYASVTLSAQQITAARKNPISVTPYVELGIAEVVRYADNPVRVSLLGEDLRKQTPYVPTSIGYIMSPRLAGKYTVELINESQLIGTTNFYATDEAIEAYKKMRTHILIEIRDSDEPLIEIPFRPVIYNFPPEYYKNGDIDIVETTPPRTATIRLIPVNPTPTL